MARTANTAFAGASMLLDGSMRYQMRLAWRLLRDERVSGFKYILPTLVALYVASPVDPIPDFILGLGQMDDLGVVVAAMVLLVRIIPRLAPQEVVNEHLRHMGSVREQHPESAGVSDQVVDATYSVRR